MRARRCPVCGQPMKKNGRSAAGTQRWKCTACALSTTATHISQVAWRQRVNQLEEFIAWATSSRTQGQDPSQARALRRRTAWCWQVPAPQPPVTGEVYRQVFIDGIYLAGGWVLLIACTTSHVLAWQWASSENTAAYQGLLQHIAPPDLVTTDGAAGALAAIRATWPTTRVQRCLVHVHRDTRRDLTGRPRTEAGRALLALSKKLLSITTTEQATKWLGLLNDFGTHYHSWLNQRTTAAQDPANARGRTWWYTHQRTRRAWRRLTRLASQGTLFAYLTDPDGRPTDHTYTPTTNQAESLNSVIRGLLRAHRGASPDHQASIIEWTLALRTIQPPEPAHVLKQWDDHARPPRRKLPTPQHAPTHRARQGLPPGTPTPEEGLWARHGWAGRTH